MHDSDPRSKESVDQPADHDAAEPELRTCPLCAAVGLPERIAIHDCQIPRKYERRYGNDGVVTKRERLQTERKRGGDR